MLKGIILFAILTAIVLPIVVIVLLQRRAAHRALRSKFVAKSLMTNHESAFFLKLNEAAERLGFAGVFPQVAMGALIDARKGIEATERRTTRNKFDRKIIDFVLVNEKMEVLVLVELDDATHHDDKDQARDAITSAAGYRTARFRNGHKISIQEIENGLRQILRPSTSLQG